MLEGFPKKVTLKDGAVITLRPMTRDDENDVYMFFSSLPEEARRYLRNDVTNRKIIAGWMRDLNYEKTVPIIAEHDGKLVAGSTLHRQTFGWGRHVGEVRVVIDPAFQNRGLGGLLFDEISQIASESGLKKLVARIVTARAGVIKAFERSGFDRIATLRNYVKDIHQNYADIAIMVKELASKTSTGG
ncbi:MAG TPA: GNAT family N-acetyltransferase [Thermodesulfovibrionales bacterium]|nr:GNAT family N-acetyltransferase [Thermodesulfovibrionales bacterium]